MNRTAKPHVIPLKIYLGVGLTLIVFTGITIAVSFAELGSLNIIVALGIATFKALLVAFFFMHLYYDNKFYLFVFTTSIFFLSVLITLTLLDTLRRGDIYSYKQSPIEPKAKIYGGSKEKSPELLAGKAVFQATCMACHLDNTNGLLPEKFSGLGEEFIFEFISRAEYARGGMPAFSGTDNERRLLAQYLYSETDTGVRFTTGQAVFDKRCGFCHTKEGDFQPIIDSFYGSIHEDIVELVPFLPDMIENMIPWLGTEEELELLAKFIVSWYQADTKNPKER